ncbi:Aldo/keto reductase [Penicillium chermesinum]|uniref:Aldo/keto reductase n=1 Tax=Penicillium chermesinum TaxID=63820 RepID=A0A9W9PIL7_9EURO|nr:Aldo/keto reductase [Penicillium chermesinum]KAJ5247488.1 Aldo/keto reductase [Penicillium chermesinum]
MASRKTLPTRALGRNGPLVPRLGLGLMGTTGIYGAPRTNDETFELLDAAFERGEIFWDTADKYGNSEDVLGAWFAANPEKRKDVFLATKFGFTDMVGGKIQVDTTPEYAQAALEKSLKRLGLPFVDLYYVHRLDKVTPIEKTMKALVELKDAGKVKHIGLSECSAETLRRACAVHPVACVQIEYSLSCMEIEWPKWKLLETARELGVAIVAYSPLGNGLVTSRIRSREDVSKPGDRRGNLPWLREDNIKTNLSILDRVGEIAKAKNATSAQLCLAWLLAQGDDIFPIPGSSKISRLDENLGSLLIRLSSEEEKELRQLGQSFLVERFQNMTGFAFGDTPALEE